MSANGVIVLGGDYEHTCGISQRIGGIDVDYRVARLLEVFERMLSDQCYDVCEFSLANFIMLKDRGADWINAIPVFPYRAFRHSTLYVRMDSALRAPHDLRGKRVAVPDFSMTAAVWTRGILAEQYGVDWRDLHWVTTQRQRFAALPGVDLEHVDYDLETALLEGRVDALISPDLRDRSQPAPTRRTRSLIANVQMAEEDYFERFGVYPINHVIAIHTKALRRLPALPAALYQAYETAKSAAYERRLGTTLVPWGQRYWAQVFEKFGGDPLPYGLTPTNEDVISRLIGFLHDQKLISSRLRVADLFLPVDAAVDDVGGSSS